MRQTSADIPADYPVRVQTIRKRLELTQTQLAERIGVSFATVNRWENGQSKPTRLAWQQILDLESEFATSQERTTPGAVPAEAPSMLDFAVPEPSALQDLLKALPDIVKAAAGAPLQFQLVVTFGDRWEFSTDTIESINRLLEKVSPNLRLKT